jgi:phosphoribosylformylglycinamidine synthase
LLSQRTEDASKKKLASSPAGVFQLFRYPGLPQSKAKSLLRRAQEKASSKIIGIDSEVCYNVSTAQQLTENEAATLAWLLRETYEPELLTPSSRFASTSHGDETVVEVSL